VTLTFQPWALIYLRTPKWIKEQLDYLNKKVSSMLSKTTSKKHSYCQKKTKEKK